MLLHSPTGYSRFLQRIVEILFSSCAKRPSVLIIVCYYIINSVSDTCRFIHYSFCIYKYNKLKKVFFNNETNLMQPDFQNQLNAARFWNERAFFSFFTRKPWAYHPGASICAD